MVGSSILAAGAGTGALIGLNRDTPAENVDTIIVGLSARGIRTLDPQKVAQGVDVWTLGHVYDKLFDLPRWRFPQSIEELVPRIGLSWQASADATEWTIELRRGVQFQGGYGEVTSDDVKYSFDRILDVERIGIIRPIATLYASVETNGRYSVVFRLGNPDPLFPLSVLTSSDAIVFPRAWVDEVGDEGLTRQAVGTGPYELETFYDNPSDGVSLIANADHFAGAPATHRLHFKYIADTTARTLAALSGEVHMIDGVRAPGWAPAILQRDPSLQADIVEPGSSFFLAFNLEYEPFADIRVRQAICYAINRDQIVEAMTPFGSRMYGINHPSFPGAFTDETLPEEVAYRYDPERARELLVDAGYPNGLDISVDTSQREDYSAIMLMIQEQLRSAGINMNLTIKDHTSFHAGQDDASNTLSQTSKTMPPIPTAAFAEFLTADNAAIPGGQGGRNFSRYGAAIEGIDEMLEAALAEPNPDRRRELVNEMEVQTLRDAVFFPVCATTFMMVRVADMDLGYEVESGYPNWPLSDARVTTDSQNT